MTPLSPGDLLLLPTCKGIEVIAVSSIVRIEAISNYSKLYFANGKTLVVAKVLRWFEETLPASLFLRVHRTHLLNKNFIYQYMISEVSKVRLVNGECIDVSRRKKSFVVQSLYNRAA